MSCCRRRFAHQLAPCLLLASASLVAAIAGGIPRQLAAADGELELAVRDAQTKEPTAVRIELRDARGRRVPIPGLTRSGTQFVFDGRAVLKLKPGSYAFRLEKGPEYRLREGNFVIERGAADHHEVDMRRYVDMPAEGWWSGDLQVQLPPGQLPLVMLAEDLHMAPLVTRSNVGRPAASTAADALTGAPQAVGHTRWWVPGGIRVLGPGSDLLLLGMTELPELPDADSEYPSPLSLLKAIEATEDVHVHLATVVDRDLPAWVATGQVDSVGVLHSGLHANGSVDPPQTKPRDKTLFPDPLGVGRWADQVYFRLLESGHRIPPGAGSGAGQVDNPAGYNRVYVHCGAEFSVPAWWAGLKAGRVVITNGPLLRPRVNGQLPGHVFTGVAGDELALQVELELGTQEKIGYLELIQNGRSAWQVRLADWAAQGGQLPAVRFRESGWLLVRVVTENSQTYRAASSGPFYVEFADRPRVSRAAAQFFLDWVFQRARQLEIADPVQRSAVLTYHRAARDYWQQRVAAATAD